MNFVLQQPLSDEIRHRVVALRAEGWSYRKIGEALRISHTSAANVIKDAQAAGLVPPAAPPAPPSSAPRAEPSPPPKPKAPPPPPQEFDEPKTPAAPAVYDEIAALQRKLVELDASAVIAFKAKDFAAHSTIVRSISMVTKDLAKLRGDVERDPEQDKDTQAAGKRAADRLRKLLAEAVREAA